MDRKQFGRSASGALLLMLLLVPWAFAQAPVREITQIVGEVYRFRNQNHYSVFAVTPAGIIATDPINADAAQWLKAELQRRFNRPVKYLIYSHDHADHIAGVRSSPIPPRWSLMRMPRLRLSGERRPTAVPQITFSDQMTIELGGTVLELSYVGRNHSDNSIVMRFPKERVLFASISSRWSRWRSAIFPMPISRTGSTLCSAWS